MAASDGAWGGLLGVRHDDGEPLFRVRATDDLIVSLEQVTDDVHSIPMPPSFDELPRFDAPDPEDPQQAGWALVVAENDPERERVVEALDPLMKLRGRDKARAPVIEVPAGVATVEWIDETYIAMGDTRPAYLLLAGNPVVLPFDLQVGLGAAGAFAGRVCFDGDRRLDDLAAYAAKVVKASEKATTTSDAVLLATDGGSSDVTSYSRRYLAEPVARMLSSVAGLQLHELTGPDATKEGLLAALKDRRPALLFTASHGAGEPTGNGPERQRANNGAIGCQPTGDAQGRPRWEWLHASDLPDEPFVPNGLMMQFACFGAGTSDRSGFSRWLGGTNAYDADVPFVAAMPQRLLARPDGPIAFIGHVDVAVLHGFYDPAGGPPPEGANPRLQPLLGTLRHAVANRLPVGYALRELTARAATFAAQIATSTDLIRSRGVDFKDLTAVEKADLIDYVIRRNDAKNFILLGDPAAFLRIDYG